MFLTPLYGKTPPVLSFSTHDRLKVNVLVKSFMNRLWRSSLCDVFVLCFRDIDWNKRANQLASALPGLKPPHASSAIPWHSELSAWTTRCTANWANKLSLATVNSSGDSGDTLPPVCLENKFNTIKVLTSCTFKDALCSFGEDIFIGRNNELMDILCPNKLNKLSFHDWINKLALKENSVSHCLTLCICGGPCHLSNCVLGTLFSSENSLFIQLWKNKHISEFVLLPH